MLFLLFAAVAAAEKGVTESTTSATWTELKTTTVTDETFVTEFTAAANSTVQYEINNQTFTVSDTTTVTLTNCPCTFTDLSVVRTAYTNVEYASDYWITVNATTETTAETSATATDGTSSSASDTVSDFVQLTSTGGVGKMVPNVLGALAVGLAMI